MSSNNSNEYESHYESGGGMLMSNNDLAYGYHHSMASDGSARSSNAPNTVGMMPNSSAKTSFFQSSNQSKYEDLKQMLESSKELLKLEAMKRIITMVAKGRSAESARELFPHVVKNVVTKNTELKKLVYLYLTRYAEQEQDLALLSIATFQHALKDPNPLIRGSAIRVLSSIRVPMISPIVLIAIKDCANDMSPYVRKTAAHAIPKLVSLDADIKDEVIDIIAKLLADKVSLVLGSAVAAFEQVCPERFDLIHENYRKLCHFLVDVDEWGQIIIINMLVRYARTQFVNPNKRQQNQSNSTNKASLNQANIDNDHMLLIRSAKPLLQSRNSGVVLAVIQLYLSVAPHFEITASLVRPLIRLLHSHYEIQLIILKNIATLTSNEFNEKWLMENDLVAHKTKQTNSSLLMNDENTQENLCDTHQSNHSTKESDEDQEDEESGEEDKSGSAASPNNRIRTIKSLFEPYLKSFFVKANDSTQIKILKLEILTNLSNTGNYISLILREFQAYILNYQDDLEFMSATIESIGQCASRIKEIAPVCLNGLVSLLSNRNETIVAQSIVVIRTQIINKDDQIISMIVKQIVKLMDKISTPQARATIVWIVAEFSNRNRHARRLAPNILLQIAKTFIQEHDLVKLQALNLAAKLHITILDESQDGEQDHISILEPLDIDKERLKLLINYVFNLAKYDLNYDVRDRGRFLKQLLNDPKLARRILLVPKEQPNVSQRTQLLVQQPTQQQSQSANTNNNEQSFQSSNNMAASSFLLASTADSVRFRFGTLSHFLGKKLSDYEELPDYPEKAPDSSVRKQQQPEPNKSSGGANSQLDDKFRLRPRNGFLSDSDYDEEEEEDEEDEDVEDEEEEEDEDLEEEEDEMDNEDYEDVDDEEEDEDEEEEDEDEEFEEEEEEDDEPEVITKNKKEQKKKQGEQQTNVDLLLDLSDLNINETMFTPNSVALHEPLLPLIQQQANKANLSDQREPYRVLESSELVTYKEFVLLEIPYQYKVSYRFPRINEGQRTLVELVLKSLKKTNEEDNQHNMNRITIEAPKNDTVLFRNVGECQENTATMPAMDVNETRLVVISVDFNESPSLGIELIFNRSQQTKLVAPLGDILYPVRFRSLKDFLAEQAKLTGMNEVVGVIKIEKPKQKTKSIEEMRQSINQIILTLANVCTNQHFHNSKEEDEATTPTFYYSACTVKFRSLILITIKLDEPDDSGDKPLTLHTVVNCEKMVLGSIISKLIKDECLKLL